jgi:hypothetical protein
MIVLVAERDAIGSRYAREILAQAGMTFEERDPAYLEVGGKPALIVLAGDGRLDASSRPWLEGVVGDGTGLVVTGGTWGLDDLLGVTDRGDTPSWLTVRDPDHPVTRDLESSLHVSCGRDLVARDGLQLATGIVAHRVGKGTTVAIGANIPASVLHIQQGREIHEDGLPAPDTTAPIDDGILKTDDGIVLDWERDRIRTGSATIDPESPGLHPDFPAGDTPWFGIPIADELRAILLNAIHWVAAETGTTLPFVAPWPRGLAAVGHISHDSDGNLDAGAHSTLDVLARGEVRSTWCHIWGPNYPERYDRATFGKILDAGHEFALHYNALANDGGTWGRDHLASQAAFVRNEAGVEGFHSNKNHYLRWEGKLEFYRWLLDEGIAVDESKGPSKKGNVGYPHGSGLPWFPFDAGADEAIDVLEIPLQFQDLWLTAPAHLHAHTIRQALKHHGIAHFLFHQIHIHTKPQVVDALLETVRAGREAGLEWWTAREIDLWTRSRRHVRVVLDGESLRLTTPIALEGVTIVIPDPAGPDTWHGQAARSITLDLPVGETVLPLQR